MDLQNVENSRRGHWRIIVNLCSWILCFCLPFWKKKRLHVRLPFSSPLSPLPSPLSPLLFIPFLCQPISSSLFFSLPFAPPSPSLSVLSSISILSLSLPFSFNFLPFLLFSPLYPLNFYSKTILWYFSVVNTCDGRRRTSRHPDAWQVQRQVDPQTISRADCAVTPGSREISRYHGKRCPSWCYCTRKIQRASALHGSAVQEWSKGMEC